MKLLLIVIALAVIVVLILLAIVLLRGGKRSYQKYSGMERQRGAAKQSRVAGADRLKNAERYLVEAQQQMVARGEYSSAQTLEAPRTRLSTLADRLRHATYGYSPIGSPNPIRETELAELQERDSDTISEAQAITELCKQVKLAASEDQPPDLKTLQFAVEHLMDSLDRRGAVS